MQFRDTDNCRRGVGPSSPEDVYNGVALASLNGWLVHPCNFLGERVRFKAPRQEGRLHGHVFSIKKLLVLDCMMRAYLGNIGPLRDKGHSLEGPSSPPRSPRRGSRFMRCNAATARNCTSSGGQSPSSVCSSGDTVGGRQRILDVSVRRPALQYYTQYVGNIAVYHPNEQRREQATASIRAC